MRLIVVLIVAAGASSCGGSDVALYDPDGWDSRAELLAARRALRAYDGAPPIIPHETASRGRENCNSCHAPGATHNRDRVGSPRSHPAWGDCRQCHVEQPAEAAFRGSEFEPWRAPSAGSRLYPAAPPTIPHSTQNRENCEVCHIGTQAPKPLRARHGKRPNCAQCHVEGAGSATFPPHREVAAGS